MYNGIVTSTDPVWLQTVLEMLTGLFDWVGPQENAWKNVGMI